MKEHPVWIGAAGFAAMKDPPRGWPMRALVGRIDDPGLIGVGQKRTHSQGTSFAIHHFVRPENLKRIVVPPFNQPTYTTQLSPGAHTNLLLSTMNFLGEAAGLDDRSAWLDGLGSLDWPHVTAR